MAAGQCRCSFSPGLGSCAWLRSRLKWASDKNTITFLTEKQQEEMGWAAKSLLDLLGATFWAGSRGSREGKGRACALAQRAHYPAEEAGHKELSQHSLLTAKHDRTSLSFCCWHPFGMIKSVEEPLPAWGTEQLTPNHRNRGNNQPTLLGCFHVLGFLIKQVSLLWEVSLKFQSIASILAAASFRPDKKVKPHIPWCPMLKLLADLV